MSAQGKEPSAPQRAHVLPASDDHLQKNYHLHKEIKEKEDQLDNLKRQLKDAEDIAKDLTEIRGITEDQDLKKEEPSLEKEAIQKEVSRLWNMVLNAKDRQSRIGRKILYQCVEIGELKKEKKEHDDIMKEKTISIEKMKDELDEEKQKRERLVGDLKEAKENVYALGKEHDDIMKEKTISIEKMKDELDEEKQKRERLVGDLKEAKENVYALGKEHDDIMKEKTISIEKMKDELDEEKQKRERLVGDLKEAKENVYALGKEHDDIMKEKTISIEKMKDELDEEKQKRERLVGYLKEAKEHIYALGKKSEKQYAVLVTQLGKEHDDIMKEKTISIEKMKDELDEEKQKRERLVGDWKKAKENLYALGQTIEPNSLQIADFIMKIRKEKDDFQKRVAQLGKERDDIMKEKTISIKKMKDELDEEKQKSERLVGDLKEAQEKLDALGKVQYKKEHDDIMKEKTLSIKKFMGKLDEMKRLLGDDLKEDQEKLDALGFGEVAGARIRIDRNLNITDLREENSPTKLAEKSSELYDNVRTDAYEELNEFQKEEDVIKHPYDKRLNKAEVKVEKPNERRYLHSDAVGGRKLHEVPRSSTLLIRKRFIFKDGSLHELKI